MKQCVSRVLVAVLAIAALCVCAPRARASTYVLNAALSDGGTISGSIGYDVYGYLAESNPSAIPPFSFTVSGGPLAGLQFSIANNGNGLGPTWSPNTLLDFYPNGTYGPELQLAFIGDLLTGSASLITGLNGPSFISNPGYLASNGIAAYLVSGSVTVTPLPAAWTIFLIGFVGFIAFPIWRRAREKITLDSSAECTA